MFFVICKFIKIKTKPEPFPFSKNLEKKLAEVLRQSFQQCPTIGAQLRLLEVFEGISSRELVQVSKCVKYLSNSKLSHLL